jgi:hypothetical protein
MARHSREPWAESLELPASTTRECRVCARESDHTGHAPPERFTLSILYAPAEWIAPVQPEHDIAVQSGWRDSGNGSTRRNRARVASGAVNHQTSAGRCETHDCIRHAFALAGSIRGYKSFEPSTAVGAAARAIGRQVGSAPALARVQRSDSVPHSPTRWYDRAHVQARAALLVGDARSVQVPAPCQIHQSARAQAPGVAASDRRRAAGQGESGASRAPSRVGRLRPRWDARIGSTRCWTPIAGSGARHRQVPHCGPSHLLCTSWHDSTRIGHPPTTDIPSGRRALSCASVQYQGSEHGRWQRLVTRS